MKFTNMRKTLSLLLCTLLIAGMALCAGCGSQNTAGAAATVEASGVQELGEGDVSFAFIVTDVEGNETEFKINTNEETVGAALLAVDLIAGEDSEWGLYVKTVNGITLDFDKDGKYWAFYVDGEYAMTGVDGTEVTDGSTYEFKAE